MNTTSEGHNDPKPDWRGRWKRWAVEHLPSTAPRAARVQLRAAVERALARMPAETDEAEIQDIVMTLVEEIRRGLNMDAERETQALIKRLMVGLAGQLLRNALDRLKSRGAHAMLARPGYSFARLEHRLARRLERDLTGKETRDEVQAVVDAWVEARLAEQPPSPGVSGSVLVAGGAGVALGFAAAQHPGARDAAARAVQKGRELAEKGRGLLAKLLTPPPAPPAG